MAYLKLHILVVLVICAVVKCQNSSPEISPPEKPVTIPVPTTTAAPVTTASTTQASTTTVAPTTTPPPITTAAPTTPPTTTSRPTTPAPTPKPTPAPAPKPLPSPSVGNWSFTEGNVTCILVQFAAQLNVTYSKTVDNKTELGHALLNVPANASVVGGSCGGAEQWMTMSWPKETWANNVTVVFARNDTTGEYHLKYFNVTLTPDNYFPNITTSDPIELYHSTIEWSTPLKTSYRCSRPTDLVLTSNNTASTVVFSMLHEQAFRNESGAAYSNARECGGGDVPDVVPIAVGCALGALVVVVLAAYLVGRRRAASTGYLSM